MRSLVSTSTTISNITLLQGQLSRLLVVKGLIEGFGVTETSAEDGSVQQAESGTVAQQLGSDEAEECSRSGQVSGPRQRSQEQPHDGRRLGQCRGCRQQDASLEPSNSHLHLSHTVKTLLTETAEKKI